MMAYEPLRSAMTIGSADDTSLALPSDNRLRSGQQRVMDQVHTIKRSKSKQGTSSPTALSPHSVSAYEFGTFKFTPSKANGNVSRSLSTMSGGYNKSIYTQKSRTLSAKSMQRNVSNSGIWDQQISAANWPRGPTGLKPSRSDPALAQFTVIPAPVMRAKGQTVQSHQTLVTRVNRHSTLSMPNGSLTNSQVQIGQMPSGQFITEGRKGTIRPIKIEQVPSTVNMSDMTLRRAVEFLSHSDENYQQCGATFIQHTTYKEERAKQEVYQLEGIPSLVALLRSPHPGVSQAAAGALRNLVFRDHNNKLEVQHCSGIAKALQLLKETDSTETQKQITGLLWNLSSADELKGELIATALPVLTENVVVPFTCWSDSSANNNIHPDVFHSATGCLRNLSCGQQNHRQAMRNCPGLIDSLVSYVQSCVAEEDPDDKSVENCACILHNLTYQLESESPQCFREFQTTNTEDRKSPTIGCFSAKSNKAQKEFTFDTSRGMFDGSTPSGVKWLCHPKVMQTYLSLLGSSQKDATLEACCGALQNLTASKGQGSSAMSQILGKLGAPIHIAPQLRSSNPSLKKTAMSLLGNMSRTSSVQPLLAKQLLPEITSLLSSPPRERENSDDFVATACNTVRSLMMADPEFSKKSISRELVTSLADLSENGSFPKGSKAACLLLYSMWNEKNLQGALKKLDFGKSLFVNDNTTAVHRFAQVIE